MSSWPKLALAASLLLSAGCSVVPSDRYSKLEHMQQTAEIENQVLQSKVKAYMEWRSHVDKFEQRIAALERIVDPLAPYMEKNMELMKENIREGEEAGGGSRTEIFYKVQSTFSDLDLQAGTLTNSITQEFDKDDFVREYLLEKLKDKVYDLHIEIAEIVLRRSGHMATDRRLVTARLKSLNESFMALRKLAQNQSYDLSYAQRYELLIKTDHVRVEYAKTLKTDYFPAIPHFIPLATGDDYLKNLSLMNEYVGLSSTFFSNPNGSVSSSIYEDLKSTLSEKKEALKTGGIQ